VIRIGSFYKAMSLTPVGRHLVQVCLGTACHVRGGAKILDNVELTLGIKAGETTKDMKYTLKRVNCLGCCALGPVIVIDSQAHAKVAPGKVKEILNQYN
jgi:NADH-quinone oxidoreductase subunit E